jgi:hypothetical protein
VIAMPSMKQLLLFLAILVTGHLNITWYANVNGYLAVVLSHHWRLQYDDMQVNHIESNHDSDVFLMRFLHPMIASRKICSLWWKFWAFKNGHCFVICIRMEVSLRIGSGRYDCVKPCLDIAQFGSLYFGFMQNLNVSKSSNSGGAPVMKFEPTP